VPAAGGGRMGAGLWWEQGVKLEPIRMNRLGKKSGLTADAAGDEHDAGGEDEAQLRKLAGAHKMGTDVRKAIFMVMMDADDYLDATEKLLRLGLQEAQAREIVRVAFHCCSHEQVVLRVLLCPNIAIMRACGLPVTLRSCAHVRSLIGQAVLVDSGVRIRAQEPVTQRR
jgi:hypothetical protein